MALNWHAFLETKLSLWAKWGSQWSHDKWSFISTLNYSGPSWARDLPCGYSPVSECIIGTDTLGKWKNPYGVKATRTSPPYQDSKPGEISEITATIKILKEARMVIPVTCPFNSPIWPLQKTDGFWKLTVYYQNLNQIMTRVAAADPDVTS